MDVDLFPPVAKTWLARYRESLPQRLELDAIVRTLSAAPAPDLAFLDIGLPNPVMSFLLRRRGGAWATLARDGDAACQAAAVVGAEVGVLGVSGQVGFEDQSFDRVVVAADVLTDLEDAEAFVRECHRVLKPSGRLVVSVRREKPASLANWLRRHLEGPAPAGIRHGYTEHELFALLRTGFDVLDLHSYLRLHVEMVRIWEQNALSRGDSSGRVARRAALLYRVANQLDYFGRGHVLLAHCRRCTWKARVAPVLADGRTIHEAVLRRMGR